ncbi:MAG: glycosyltransferase, partial [Thermodesulfobacteriota bacterium]|nr:glycosyltransferase [Thermodesulfobacteriota bacterium]
MPIDDILVSACMIVRNEEEFLEGCLLSIKDVIDEIVVGDTGSTDRTRDIAGDLGARVYNIPWNDDFSAARNQVLEQAKGMWILSIDADERLRPISRSRIERFIKDPSNIAYYVLMHPIRQWTGMWVIRLFRNDPRIRFKGIFHETLWEGLQKALSSGNKEIGYSDLVLDHLGYESDQSEKLMRNLSLLLREIERDDNNAYIWTHLGLVYEDLGEEAQAENAWKRAIEIVREKKDVHIHEIYAYIYYIEWRLRHGKPVNGLLKEVMDYSTGNPHLYWLKGRLLMDENRYDEAIPFFERLISWGDKQDFNRLSVCYETCIFDVNAYDSLATCHFRLGNYEESKRCFQLAEKYKPET